MDTLRWHTIKGHRVFLNLFRSKRFDDFYTRGTSNQYLEFYTDIKKFDKTWFCDEEGKLFIEKYEHEEFNSKQFYKEFIKCIEPHLSKSEIRNIKITKVLEGDIYNRNKMEKIMLNY